MCELLFFCKYSFLPTGSVYIWPWCEKWCLSEADHPQCCRTHMDYGCWWWSISHICVCKSCYVAWHVLNFVAVSHTTVVLMWWHWFPQSFFTSFQSVQSCQSIALCINFAAAYSVKYWSSVWQLLRFVRFVMRHWCVQGHNMWSWWSHRAGQLWRIFWCTKWATNIWLCQNCSQPDVQAATSRR